MRRIVNGYLFTSDELEALNQAEDALSMAIDALDQWASCGPEGYTTQEKRDRRMFGKRLEKLNRVLKYKGSL